jgi:hypothetical protein
MVNQRFYKQELAPGIKYYLWAMVLYSLIVLFHNLFLGLQDPQFSIPMLCTALRVIINLADLIGLYLILRNKSIGVWIYVSTAFFIVLLSMAFPSFMSPFSKYLNIAMKLGLLLMLNLRHNDLSGYQTLGMAKIDGRFIDEWITGRNRYM